MLELIIGILIFAILGSVLLLLVRNLGGQHKSVYSRNSFLLIVGPILESIKRDLRSAEEIQIGPDWLGIKRFSDIGTGMTTREQVFWRFDIDKIQEERGAKKSPHQFSTFLQEKGRTLIFALTSTVPEDMTLDQRARLTINIGIGNPSLDSPGALTASAAIEVRAKSIQVK